MTSLLALLRYQQCSGSCTALVRENAGEYKLWRPFWASLLLLAKCWCQQSPDISKVLRSHFFSFYTSSPATLLPSSHLLSSLSRHPSPSSPLTLPIYSPVTLLLPSYFLSRYCCPPITLALPSFLLSRHPFFSYHSFSRVPVWTIKSLERSQRSALANFG